ncbi:MAG TPA: LysM domain-containing protein [Candidatus Limnocylindrales bacterium]|nr:LysM domain-containing protein [Candidatus Limnocylindrales bacterium]
MTKRLGWLATSAIALVIIAEACIPSGAAIRSAVPTTTPASTTAAASATPSPSGPSARPSFTYPTATPLPTFLIYTVRSGDTLTSIAREHATTARSIAFWNRQRYPSLDPDSPRYAPNRIEVGWQLLLIPDVELDPEDLPEPSASASAVPSSSAAG